MIDEYDKIVLGILTLVIGGMWAMIMKHSSKLAEHQRTMDRIEGELTNIPSSTELVVRKVIEGHERREDAKFVAIHEKLEDVRLELAGLLGVKK